MKKNNLSKLIVLFICIFLPSVSVLATVSLGSGNAEVQKNKRPNIVYIMGDDLTSQAISTYGGILSKVFQTPNMDRIANEGVKFTRCFVTNSICTPSRAAIMTGQYSQNNGVFTLIDKLDSRQPTVATHLHDADYYTGIIGKWHLKTEPQGFDYYSILPGQGRYNDPEFISNGEWNEDPDFDMRHGKVNKGYCTDIICNKAITFLKDRDKSKPFMLMCHFKAPHRNWIYAPRFENIFDGITMSEPFNLCDTYKTKREYANRLALKMENFNVPTDLRVPKPKNMTLDEERHWAYQAYIKNYLRCVAGVDENVGRILKYLDDNNLTENTIVVITGDQGFFLGEHGFFDKRLMYEEALRMPLLIRYPKEIKGGTINSDIILNIDFAPTFMDYAGLEKPIEMQGVSFRKNLVGKTPKNWRKSMYYRYWMNRDGSHHVTAHYGIRTERYKLIYFYGLPLGKLGTIEYPYTPDWELYDLKNDPHEMKNIYDDPANKSLIKDLKEKLLQLKIKYNDRDISYPEMVKIDKEYFWDKDENPYNDK